MEIAMTNSTPNQLHPWLTQTLAWFQQHPEREYNLTTMPIAAVPSAGVAGWIVGVASQSLGKNGILGVDVEEGATSVPCIVKRPDPVRNQNNPGIFILDGAGAMPPLPHPKNATPAQQARAEESLAGGIWSMAEYAARSGSSLFAAARKAAPPQSRHRKP
jgi:hypothetical protein